jgi:hypothetical protein
MKKNTEKLATQGTQDEEKHRETGKCTQDEEKHRETGNTEYTR